MIDPLIRQGRLPTLASLISQGCRATLRSVRAACDKHFRPQIAWPTIATGVSPDKHGITRFFHTADDYLVPTIWDRFDQAGRRRWAFRLADRLASEAGEWLPHSRLRGPRPGDLPAALQFHPPARSPPARRARPTRIHQQAAALRRGSARVESDSESHHTRNLRTSGIGGDRHQNQSSPPAPPAAHATVRVWASARTFF